MMNPLRRAAKPFLRPLLSRPAPPPPIPHPLWRRSYATTQYHHFPHRGPRRWYHNPRTVLILSGAGTAAALSVYFSSLETVPYSKRTHLILLPPAVERSLGESQFDDIKTSLRSSILPSIHPDAVRVRLISDDLILALYRGLVRPGEVLDDIPLINPEDFFDPGPPLSEEEAEEILSDDRWIQKRRHEAGVSRPATNHLEGLNWEVLVVQDTSVNAYCLPGGKIVVHTGLLDHFRTEAEIATVIGHEVGHCIARHGAETITKGLWFQLLYIVVLQFFYMPDLIRAMTDLLLHLPFSRRMEMEADYIGLLLLASAGYDPRVAPKVYEKLGQISGDSALQDYLSTHPSSKTRSQSLSKAVVMNEAIAIYREAIDGRGVEGFL